MTLSMELNPKLSEFVRKHNIVAIKLREREWGSYELAIAVGVDPKHAFVPPEMVWGSAIPIPLAIQDVLIRWHLDTNVFLQWMGQERADELKTILTEA